jgi:hypothetical protein
LNQVVHGVLLAEVICFPWGAAPVAQARGEGCILEWLATRYRGGAMLPSDCISQ